MIKNILVILAGLLSLVYLLNPTAGVFELIPDNFPIVGNLDEAAAVAIILAAFRYYGIDLTTFLGRGVKGRSQSSGKGNDSKFSS
ncbi:MAG: DUF1232 domain-containing protein [Nitrospinota bacterium]|nr:DUF1232 domain-containing protein [Nitrospinota bacterium]